MLFHLPLEFFGNSNQNFWSNGKRPSSPEKTGNAGSGDEIVFGAITRFVDVCSHSRGAVHRWSLIPDGSSGPSHLDNGEPVSPEIKHGPSSHPPHRLRLLGLLKIGTAGPKTGTLCLDNRSKDTSSKMGGLERADRRLSNSQRLPNLLSEWRIADLQVFPCGTAPSLGGSLISQIDDQTKFPFLFGDCEQRAVKPGKAPVHHSLDGPLFNMKTITALLKVLSLAAGLGQRERSRAGGQQQLRFGTEMMKSINQISTHEGLI
ncbi:hypothetical protein ACROYT_G005422 [Oculina patagonica]